jgi:hypothetical protein
VIAGLKGLKVFPEQLRIGKNTPSERDPLARSAFQKKRSARVLRKKAQNISKVEKIEIINGSFVVSLACLLSNRISF